MTPPRIASRAPPRSFTKSVGTKTDVQEARAISVNTLRSDEFISRGGARTPRGAKGKTGGIAVVAAPRRFFSRKGFTLAVISR